MGNLCQSQLSDEIANIGKIDTCVQGLVMLGYDQAQSRQVAKAFGGDLEKCVAYLKAEKISESQEQPHHEQINVVVEEQALSKEEPPAKQSIPGNPKKRTFTFDSILFLRGYFIIFSLFQWELSR